MDEKGGERVLSCHYGGAEEEAKTWEGTLGGGEAALGLGGWLRHRMSPARGSPGLVWTQRAEVMGFSVC